MSTTDHTLVPPSSGVASVGLIIPPDDIKSVIDKTAGFVAKNGDSFEQTILQKSQSQFEFLLPESPFRPYFDKRLKDIREGRDEPDRPEVPKAILDMAAKVASETTKKQQLRALTQWGEDNAQVQAPPKSLFYLKHPYIAAVDLDVIKLTAQFVARNGQPFLLGLAQREKNPQFDFLKPTHSLFQYFTSLIECYSKILKPSSDDLKLIKGLTNGFDAENEPLAEPLDPSPSRRLEGSKTTDIVKLWNRPRRSPRDILKLHEDQKDKVSAEKKVKELIFQRYLWNANEAKQTAQNEAKAAAEREANAAIDWYDFQVVATIEFFDGNQYTTPIDFTTPQAPATLSAMRQSAATLAPVPSETSGTIPSVASRPPDGQPPQWSAPPGHQGTPHGMIPPGFEMFPPAGMGPPSGMMGHPHAPPGIYGAGIPHTHRPPPGVGMPPPGPVILTPGKRARPEEGLPVETTAPVSTLTTEHDMPVTTTAPPTILEAPRSTASATMKTAKGPGGEPIKIVRNYDRSKVKQRSSGDYMVDGIVMQKCPITKQLLAAKDMSEHLRVLLLDPQWQKERENLLEKAKKESAFAPMGDVNSNLAQFVSKRPDIFGTVDDAVVDFDADDLTMASDPKKARLWYQG